MTPVIKTEVINVSRQPYSLVVNGKRVAKLRAGESITLPYDIWSVSTALGKKALETDLRKKIIKLNTFVNTENSVISISCDSNCKSTTQINAPEQKEVNVETKVNKEEKQSIIQKEPRPVNTKNVDLVSTEAHVRVASKSASVMQAVMGANTVNIEETETRVQQNPTGFTPVEQVKSSSLFTRTTKNNVEVESNNVMGFEESALNDTTEETSQEAEQDSSAEANLGTLNYMLAEDSAQELTEEEGAEEEEEEVEEASDSISVVEEVNALLTEGDIDGLIKMLRDTYPNISFTKAALKKCTNWEDIATKYNLL